MLKLNVCNTDVQNATHANQSPSPTAQACEPSVGGSAAVAVLRQSLDAYFPVARRQQQPQGADHTWRCTGSHQCGVINVLPEQLAAVIEALQQAPISAPVSRNAQQGWRPAPAAQFIAVCKWLTTPVCWKPQASMGSEQALCECGLLCKPVHSSAAKELTKIVIRQVSTSMAMNNLCTLVLSCNPAVH